MLHSLCSITYVAVQKYLAHKSEAPEIQNQAAINSILPSIDADSKTKSILENIEEIVNSRSASLKIPKILKALHPARKLEISLLKAIKAEYEKSDEINWAAVWNSVHFRLKQFVVQSGSSVLWNKIVSSQPDTDEFCPFILSADETLYTKYQENISEVLIKASYESLLLNRVEIEQNLEKIGLSKSTISGKRKIFISTGDIKLHRDTLSFFLPSGSYATMLLREWSNGGVVG
jgi:tRNA(Glu) U13 pseudouridine synthase TruD